MAFFLLFAIILVSSYVMLRRDLAPPKVVAMMSTVGSILSLTLYLVTATDATVFYSVVLGIIAGVLFSGLTMGLGLFFHASEEDAKRRRKDYWQRDLPEDSRPSE